MKVESVLYYSNILNRDLRINIYGHAGLPILAFPTQNSKADNYEGMGFIDCVSECLENGVIQMFVPDSIDEESWSGLTGNDCGTRSYLSELYFRFSTEELVPFMRSINDQEPVTFGCSMGANHAANTFLRRPDLFKGMLAFSGVFDSKMFYGDYVDDNIYNNSPQMFIPNMDPNHYYIDLYNQKKIIFVIGQGAWEDQGLPTYRYLQDSFNQKGINAWFDYWGYDVKHDWDWWFKQIHYFLPYFLD